MRIFYSDAHILHFDLCTYFLKFPLNYFMLSIRNLLRLKLRSVQRMAFIKFVPHAEFKAYSLSSKTFEGAQKSLLAFLIADRTSLCTIRSQKMQMFHGKLILPGIPAKIWMTTMCTQLPSSSSHNLMRSHQLIAKRIRWQYSRHKTFYKCKFTVVDESFILRRELWF